MDSAPVIKDLAPGVKNLTLNVIVLEVGKPSTTKDNHVIRTVRVADNTGSINMSVWNEPGEHLKPGDICRLVRVYTTVFKGCLTIYTGKNGEIIKIGEFCMLFQETPNVSEFNPQWSNEGPKQLGKGGGNEGPSATPNFRPEAPSGGNLGGHGNVPPNGRMTRPPLMNRGPPPNNGNQAPNKRR